MPECEEIGASHTQEMGRTCPEPGRAAKSEGETSKCIKDNVCMLRGRANVPCTVTCGAEQYVIVLSPEDSGALISLKTFMSQESRTNPMLTEDYVRRTLRESGV